MQKGFSYYCPILGKKVFVKAKKNKNNAFGFIPHKNRCICQEKDGVCMGNCIGCNIL